MRKPEKKKPVTIDEVLAALVDPSRPFPLTFLHQFSDLEGANLEALRAVWPKVDPDRRAMLLEDLEDLSDSDTLVSFDNVAHFALHDSDPRVRATAARLLWESDNANLIPTFIRMLQEDRSPEVRAAAATALGKFIYLGELEEISPKQLHRVEESLLAAQQGQDETLVRRRALESLGFSGREEVPGLIRAAYESEQLDWLVSALYAMGRSADTSWAPDILQFMQHSDPEVQNEAVRAAGELELTAARTPLLRMLNDEDLDNDVRMEVIWALSKIGGEDVRETLEVMLEQSEDEDETEMLEEALENLSFTEDLAMFEMFDFMDQEMVEDEGDEEDNEGSTRDNPASTDADEPEQRKSPSRRRHRKS